MIDLLKKMFNVIKKIVLSAIIIYGYNIIATPLNLQIPINIFTLCLVGVLGVPSLIGLLLIIVVFYS